MVSCRFNGQLVEALWDTGAQACIVNDVWRQQQLSDTVIHPLEELLGEATLTGLAANNTEIPFIGWVEINFQLNGGPFSTPLLKVPMLVSSDPTVAEDPIIGYNVIEEIVKRMEDTPERRERKMLHIMSSAFSITRKEAQTLLKLIQSGEQEVTVGVVKNGRKLVYLPANQVTTIMVRAHVGSQYEGQELLFSPSEINPLQEDLELNEAVVKIPVRHVKYIPISVVNTAKQNITLQRNQILGYLQSVKTVYPAATQLTEPQGAQGEEAQKLESAPEKTANGSQSELPPPAWDPPVNLNHLTNDQQEAVKKVLRDECQAFAYNDDDIGCIPYLKMHIKLHDTRPVQKTYISIPKPLHDEVKQYLQDLLNKGWVTPSRSAYSSPVVCVRKTAVFGYAVTTGS